MGELSELGKRVTSESLSLQCILGCLCCGSTDKASYIVGYLFTRVAVASPARGLCSGHLCPPWVSFYALHICGALLCRPQLWSVDLFTRQNVHSHILSQYVGLRGVGTGRRGGGTWSPSIYSELICVRHHGRHGGERRKYEKCTLLPAYQRDRISHWKQPRNLVIWCHLSPVLSGVRGFIEEVGWCLASKG